MITIRRIQPGHALYPQETALRERVLLAGAGYDFEAFVRDYPYEDAAEHFVAVTTHTNSGAPVEVVIGTALLIPGHPGPGVGKVTQVVVDPQRQGEGIGRRLMVTIESRAFGELGLLEVYCHAQNTAMGFYARLGWGVEGAEFVEAGIPHHKMCIRHPGGERVACPPPQIGPDLDLTSPD
ncbi:MAG: GNAT family N-acetyltransferase [Phycisphaeraceae bacterium]|nr:MAG: GNAT family N-acetyltransferase [Phycisphaeraceae bacterium]